jgi:hypothetical protein
MSDGMTDTRSQEEPLFTTQQFDKMHTHLKDKLAQRFLNHPDFQEMKVRDVRALSSDTANFCMNEIMGFRK